MTDTAGVEGHGPVEPVSATAHLSRSPHAGYTEVDGRPVLCHVRTRQVHQISPGFAALWSFLDGGMLDDALMASGSSRLAELPDADRRAITEAVRRAKAAGLLVDVPRAEVMHWRAEPIGAVAAPPSTIQVHGRVDLDDEAGEAHLALAPNADTVAIELAPDEGDLRPSLGGHPLATVTIDAVSSTAANAVATEPVLRALAAWVECVALPGDSTGSAAWHPGLLDALATLAENFSGASPAGSAS